MYFVRYNPLKQKLRNRSLSEREALPYLILTGVVWTIFTFDVSSEDPNAFNVASMIISIAILIGGAFHVYEQNGGKEGFDLVRKYLVLGWVVGFRVCLVSVPAMMIVAFLLAMANLEDALVSMLILLCLAVAQIVYYQRLGRHIHDTVAVETDTGEQPILP